MNRIDSLFARKRAEGAKSLIIFLSAGYPDLPTSVELAAACAEAGADLIEFGVPFSDPIADGPTIQRSSAIALQRGVTLNKILAAVPEIRKRTAAPVILFGALNPFLHHGLEKVVREARAAGADGFIIPDLPPEESGEFESICRAEEMAMTHLLAPTSPPERRRLVAKRSMGFLYYMSVKGVTGARKDLPPDLADNLRQIRALTDKPLAVGFGISTPEHVRQGAAVADAVVVGSAAINLIGQYEGKPELLGKVRDYVASLAGALK
ncbi:MAG: tryptophan synthase subunit alpha [Candidatus Sumerlaeota bacterium]|nr:tryptophan synthase subunit alpha [Candidatus Sumerlaeota bacterium]